MIQPLIQIGSLDLFWMPRLASALGEVSKVALCSTWSLKSSPPQVAQFNNAWHLHYLLAAYKRFPLLQKENWLYLELCKAFDRWWSRRLPSECHAVYLLSGCGLQTAQKARANGAKIIVDSGSTHTDFQHRIVWEEYQRNGLRAPLFPEAYRTRLRQEFAMMDFIQIPSGFVKQTYLEAGIPESKILKATYGTDVARFSARKETDLNPMFRAICPSGVNLRKGARLLVEAWRKLGWKETEAELHWVGWPGHPDVKHLFRDPLRGVIWHGWMPHSELCKLYRSCDVLVLPSFEEGFARVLVEGAASGLPPIATPNTGIEDFFTPGNPEGWLIPCNDVDALCEALIEAKSDRQKTFELGQQAAARARSGFSWEDYGVQVRGNFGRVTSGE
jgi:glycosyltransferase involved in cell wall biosynthesis